MRTGLTGSGNKRQWRTTAKGLGRADLQRSSAPPLVTSSSPSATPAGHCTHLDPVKELAPPRQLQHQEDGSLAILDKLESLESQKQDQRVQHERHGKGRSTQSVAYHYGPGRSGGGISGTDPIRRQRRIPRDTTTREASPAGPPAFKRTRRPGPSAIICSSYDRVDRKL